MGQVYVTVIANESNPKARSAGSPPSGGGATSLGVTINWVYDGGISGKSWDGINVEGITDETIINGLVDEHFRQLPFEYLATNYASCCKW